MKSMKYDEYVKSIQIDAVEHRTCKYCNETKHNSLFLTKYVCRKCKYNIQRQNVKNSPNYRCWRKYKEESVIDYVKERTCYRCNKTKVSSEFRSRKTCAECYRLVQAQYRKRVSVAKGKYWQLSFSAKRRNILFLITLGEFTDWFDTRIKECFYCGKNQDELKNSKDRLDVLSQNLSIDRMNNNEGYALGNITLCCRRCNTIKGDFFTKEEMLEIGNIIKRRNEVK